MTLGAYGSRPAVTWRIRSPYAYASAIHDFRSGLSCRVQDSCLPSHRRNPRRPIASPILSFLLICSEFSESRNTGNTPNFRVHPDASVNLFYLQSSAPMTSAGFFAINGFSSCLLHRFISIPPHSMWAFCIHPRTCFLFDSLELLFPILRTLGLMFSGGH